MIEIDVGWMPLEAQKTFEEAVGVFVEAIRTGEISGYHTGVQRMRRAGQILIQQEGVSLELRSGLMSQKK